MPRPEMYVSWAIGDALEPNPFGSTEPVRAKTSGAPLRRVYPFPLSLPYPLLCQLSHKPQLRSSDHFHLLCYIPCRVAFPVEGVERSTRSGSTSPFFLLRVNDLQYADRGSSFNLKSPILS